MAIFPSLITEAVVSLNDKTRLDASKSFVSKDSGAITKVEIEPEAGVSGYIEVTGAGSKDWYLDWSYSGVTREILARCKVWVGVSFQIAEAQFLFKEPEDEKLFSSDQDLVNIKSDIMKWVPDGRNSFINYHRRAQELILAWFDEKGFTFADGTKITRDAVVDIEEVRQWSIFLSMSLIMRDLSNKIDDVFDQQAKDFESKSLMHRQRAIFRLDLNKDGIQDNLEGVNVTTMDLARS